MPVTTSPRPPIPPADQPARLDALEAAVRARSDLVPRVGIVLGSGLGGLADDLDDAIAIPFAELPGWPAATAPGHVGRLLLGRLGGTPVVMLQGRFHLYEGNDPGLVVQPVLLFRRLGAEIVVLTNAAGGVDPAFGPGTLMVIADHLNLTGRTPLLGQNADDDRAAVPGPDRRLEPASPARRSMPPATRRASSWPRGSTPACSGRSTRPRQRSGCSGRSGADAVGMSTVLECIAARWSGLEVCGVSLVTNAGAGLHGRAADPRGGPCRRRRGRPRVSRA